MQMLAGIAIGVAAGFLVFLGVGDQRTLFNKLRSFGAEMRQEFPVLPAAPAAAAVATAKAVLPEPRPLPSEEALKEEPLPPLPEEAPQPEKEKEYSDASMKAILEELSLNLDESGDGAGESGAAK